MNTYRDLRFLNLTGPTACGLGNFDGIHLGHQKLIKELNKQAKMRNIKSTIITFEPYPYKILFPNRKNFQLTTAAQKEEIIRDFGVDNLVFIPFTSEFSKISHVDFVDNILVKKFKPEVIVVGFNFRFGHKGQGTAGVLKQLCKRHDIDVVIIPPVTYRSKVISSSLIKSLIVSGKVKKAAALMGRPYCIEGTVIHGDARGRTLGFPTTNISFPKDIVLPVNGVYAVKVIWNGHTLKGVANLGIRPTFNKKETSLEVHLFDFNKQIYGENLKVYFIDLLRRERKFNNVEALINQIENDFIKAKKILSRRYR